MNNHVVKLFKINLNSQKFNLFLSREVEAREEVYGSGGRRQGRRGQQQRREGQWQRHGHVIAYVGKVSCDQM